MLNASFLKAGESATCSQPPTLQSWGRGCLWGKTGLLCLAQEVLQVGGITRLVTSEQGAGDDLRTPCVCQEEVPGLLLQDLSTCMSIGLAEALAHCCLGGQPLMWGDHEGLPTDILQYQPSGKSGDGDLHVFLTIQENVFQV